MEKENQSLQGKHIIFFDGFCKLCNYFIQFVLQHDQKDQFKILSLQSAKAHYFLNKYHIKHNQSKLDTVLVLTHYQNKEEKILEKSDASLFVLTHLKSSFSWINCFYIIPKPIRDAIYTLIATIRYTLFGKFKNGCPLPKPEYRHKILD